MRLDEVAALPPVLTTAQLADLTDTDPRVWWAYARGEIECSIDVTPIRVGARVLRWPTAPILTALGLSCE